MRQTVEDVISFMNEAIRRQRGRMEDTEADYYPDEDRARFKAKVWKIRELQPALEALPELIAALQVSFPHLNQEALEREHEGDIERADHLSEITDQILRALQNARQDPV